MSFFSLVGADRGLRLGQGRSATLLLLFLGVLGALGQQLAVLGLGLLGGLGAGALELIILVFYLLLKHRVMNELKLQSNYDIGK